MNQEDQKDVEFYKLYQKDNPNNVKLFITFGRKNYKTITKMPIEIQNFLLDNYRKVKPLGFENFKLLVDNYGLYNIKDVIIKNNEEELKKLSKGQDLIKYMDEIVKEGFDSSNFISLTDSPRIKVIFSDLFESSLYKENPNLINKMFLSENAKLTFSESISFIKSGVNISLFPITKFNENIQTFLQNIGTNKISEILKITPDDKLVDFFNLNFNDKKIQNLLNNFSTIQIKEILTIMPSQLVTKYFNQYDDNIGYQLNMWTCLRDNNELEKNTEIVSYLLSSFNIRTSFDVMINSSLYNGMPINLSDFVTAEQYNKLVDISQQQNITFANFKELYNHFDEEKIKEIIRTAISRVETDNSILRCDDKFHKLDLMSCIKNGNYKKIPELLNGFLRMIKDAPLYRKQPVEIQDNIVVKALEENKILSMKLTDRISDSIIDNNYATLCEWLKKLNPGEQLYLSFIGVFSLEEAKNILDKKAVFDSILNHKIFEDQREKFNFQMALTAAMLVFNTFNDPSTIDELIECYSTLESYNFIDLFKNISMRLDPKFLKDIRINYKQLNLSSFPYEKEHDKRIELEKIFKNIDKYNFKSANEVINYLNFGYKNVHPNCAFATYQMRERKVAEEYYSYYSRLYETAIKRKGLVIPSVSGESDYFTFESVRLWDDRLLNFDLESGIKISSKAKDKLFLANNCRLIEVKSKNGKVVDQIYVQIDSEYNINLVSLMNSGDELFQRKMFETIIDKLNAQYDKKEIEVNFNISNQINEDISEDSKLELFDEPPKIIEPKTYLLSDNKENEADAVKIANINRIAFESNNNSVHLKEVMTKGAPKTCYFVGRDWYIKLDEWSKEEQNNPHKHINFIARHSNDNSKEGGSEMVKCISDITSNSNIPINVAAFATSYYLFSKLAASGEIYIVKDQFIRQTIDGFFSDHWVVSSYLLEDGNVNLNFDSELNYNGYEETYGKSANEMTFISSKNITSEQHEKLEIQKKIYSRIVGKLEESRKEAKHENRNQKEYPNIFERDYLKLEKTEKLKHISNLRSYSTAYLNYVLVKSELASNLWFYTGEDIKINL